MPANRTTGEFPSPWKGFLAGVDGMLTEPLELHCIGGFVLTFYYGLPRTTGDIDYFAAVPANLNLDEIAGQDSPLHKKHKVWLHRVGLANLPEDYAVRLEDMAPGQSKHLKLRGRATSAAPPASFRLHRNVRRNLRLRFACPDRVPQPISAPSPVAVSGPLRPPC